jgi:hypothetical protein
MVRLRVRRALLIVVLLVLGAPAAGARPLVSTSGIVVDKATVNASWRQGWLRAGAAVIFSGRIATASTLNAVLRPVAHPGRVTAQATFDVEQAGAFTRRLRLPPRPLPGRYTLRVSRSAPLGAVKRVVVIPAPPEGVLDRALVGTTKDGPWQAYNVDSAPVVHGSHNELWMRFHFLSPPTGRVVELTWKYRWHIVVGKVYKRYKHVLLTYAKSGTPLAHGNWIVTLRIGGRVAKQMDVVLR